MKRATARQLVGLCLLGAVVVAAAVTIPPEELFAHADTLASRPALAAVVVGTLYLLRPLFAWPISALSMLLGYLYGPSAIVVALLGATVTTLPPYLLARHIGHDAGVLGRVGTAAARIRTTTGGVRGVAAARLAPLPTDPVSYTAGLAGVRPIPYVVGTVIGEMPWVVGAVLLGASMGTLTAGGTLTDPLVVVGAVCAAALLLAGPVYRHVRAEPAT
ncbi:MAG: VTT domain-containing protein [Natronomonas sp.]